MSASGAVCGGVSVDLGVCVEWSGVCECQSVVWCVVESVLCGLCV